MALRTIVKATQMGLVAAFVFLSSVATAQDKCASPQAVLSGIKVTQTPMAETLIDLPAPPEQLGSITVSDAVDLHGPCAGNLVAVHGPAFLFETRVALSWSGADRLAVTTNGPGLSAAIADRTLNTGPSLTGAERFVRASVVDRRRTAAGLETDYVGLWRGRTNSVVAIFTRRDDGVTSVPRPLLKAQGLLSATYFPAPDTASGDVGLVQSRKDGSVRVLRLRWSHPGVFKPLPGSP